MEKENSGKSERKYVMATIMMPIEICNLEEDEYVCLQDRARVSLAFCKDLPEIAGEGDGYGGLSEKIHNLFASSSSEEGEEKGEDVEDAGMVGAIGNSGVEKSPVAMKRKKNITYRAFRQNEKSHRYTFKHI